MEAVFGFKWLHIRFKSNFRVSDIICVIKLVLVMFRFAEATMDGKGYDRVRRTEIGKKRFKLTHFEEV